MPKYLSDSLIKELENNFSLHDSDAICNLLNAFANEDQDKFINFEDWLNCRFVVSVEKPVEKLRYPLSDPEIEKAVNDLMNINDDKQDFHDILWPAMAGRGVMHMFTICNWLRMWHTRPVFLHKLSDDQFMTLVGYLLYHIYWNSLKKVEQFDLINNLNYNTKRLEEK